MLVGLLKMAGFGILVLVYGKEEYEKRWLSTPKERTEFVQYLLSLAFFFWLVCSLSWIFGATANDTLFCAVFSLAFPVLIAVWAFIVRKRAKKEDE